MYYDQNPNYYGKASVSVDGTKKEINFKNDAQKFVSPIHITYYYNGDRPDSCKICLENLKSESKNCVTVDKNQNTVNINMPD